MTEALGCLIQMLLGRKRLQGLEVVRESCLQNCPAGRICVALARNGSAVRHHLAATDDLRTVAAKLAGTAKT